MFKKTAIVIIVLAVAAFLYWTVSPLFVDKQVEEKIEDLVSDGKMQEPSGLNQGQEKIDIVSAGQFTGLANHEAQGTARIIKVDEKYFIRFEEDFRSSNGPDVHVYLGRNGNYDPQTDLGLIKGNIGSQNYDIPGSINIGDYNEVWIWCRAFSVPFGKAELKKEQT
ncbi:MAG TPA: hypothetical protein DIC35_05220 [Candidatus Moranbacteria bacterium]|nr:hypothetical protein [Candidatus Moranbacteria bacterium]